MQNFTKAFAKKKAAKAGFQAKPAMKPAAGNMAEDEPDADDQPVQSPAKNFFKSMKGMKNQKPMR